MGYGLFYAMLGGSIGLIYIIILLLESWKNKEFYEKYKIAVNIVRWGIVITFLLIIMIFILGSIFNPGSFFYFTYSAAFIMLFVGVVAIFPLSIIGLIIDRIRFKKR